MKKAKLALAMVPFILALAPFSFAQDRFQASLNFLMAYPQNDFRSNVDRTFYGLSGEFFYRPRRSPLSLGVSLEYLNYGNETRTESWDEAVPEVWVDVTTRNSLFSVAAVLRLSPEAGFLRPYVEGLVGFNYLFTYTSVRDDDSWSEAIATTTNFDDWTLAYGVGAGAILRALEVRNRRGGSVFSLYLEFGLRYLKGGTAEYLRENGILRNGGSLAYVPLTSTTDLVKSRLGVVFLF